jgi:hypothetical protein
VSDITPCYIGINKEGSCRAACVDEPAAAKQTARTVADWIKRGLTVERVTVAEARKRLSPNAK